MSGPADYRSDDADWAAAPRLVLRAAEDPLAHLLRAASAAVLKHPIAAQAIFAGLVAEGRRFAETEEGRRWKAALADSEFVRRARALWEGSVFNLLEDSADAVLPSAIFDALVQAASRPDLPALLRMVLQPGDRDADRS